VLLLSSVVTFQKKQGQNWNDIDPGGLWIVNRDENLGTITNDNSDGVYEIFAQWITNDDGTANKKIEFRGTDNGTVRWQWVLTLEPGQFWSVTPEDEGVELNYDDYVGNISDDKGEPVRTIIFEPDGVADNLTVDPYVSVREEANLAYINTNTYVVQAYLDGTSAAWDAFLKATNGTTIFNIGFGRFTTAAGTHLLSRDTSRGAFVQEANELRATFFSKGIPRISGGASLSNCEKLEHYIHFYEDRIAFQSNLSTTGNITLTNDAVGGQYFVQFEQNGAGTNSVGYGNAGTEVVVNGINTTRHDYFFFNSSTGHMALVPLAVSNGTGAIYGHSNTESILMGFNDITKPAGAHTAENLFVVDINFVHNSEAAREKLSNFGDDRVDPTVNTGSAVTDLNIPRIIDTDSGFAGDSAYHLDLTSDRVGKVTFGQNESNSSVILHEYPILTGASPGTSHIINHLKLQDNAANSVIIATTGVNANWENISDGSDRNTSTAGDSVDAIRGKGLDTQDGAGHIDMDLTEHLNAYFVKGSVLIIAIPQFAEADAADQTLFHLYINGNDSVEVRYESSADRYYASFEWNNGLDNLFGPSYDKDADVQRATRFLTSWDTTHDFALFSVDDNVTTSRDSSPVGAGNPTKFTVGAKRDRTTPGDYIIDSVRTYDKCIIPYGSHIQGNVESDYSDAHANILFHWKGNDVTGTNVEIGGVQGTLGGSGGTFTAGGPVNETYFDTEGTANLQFTVTSGDIFNFNKGSISFWFNAQSTGVNESIFGIGDATDFFRFAFDGSNNLDITYQSQSTAEQILGDVAITTGYWYNVRITWDDTPTSTDNKLHFYLDGNEIGNAPPTIANVFQPNATETLYFGANESGGSIADVFISWVQITNNQFTPVYPIVLDAGPIWVPKTLVGT
jgi:hypothetical protein